MDIKPIPTRYQNYHFRSRSEARWAVFFDKAGIQWRYELEGFELPSGRRYLPDFYLPKHDAYVEVKREGYASDPSADEILTAVRGAEFAGADWDCYRRTLIVLAGTPGRDSYEATAMMKGAVCGEMIVGRLGLGRRTPQELWVVQRGTEAAFCVKSFDDSDHWPLDFSGPIQDAYAAARSARFEFGESGAT